MALSNAGLAHRLRSELTGGEEDLQAAIELSRASVTAAGTDQAALPGSRSNLSRALFVRWQRHRDAADLRDAVAGFRAVARLAGAPRQGRLQAAVSWAACATAVADWPAAADAYETAVDLLELVVWHGLPRAAREAQLARLPGLASQAAASALAAGDPARALAVLDRGRSVLWTQQLRLRSSFDEVRDAAPELHQQLVQLAEELGRDPAARRPGRPGRAGRRARPPGDWGTPPAAGCGLGRDAGPGPCAAGAGGHAAPAGRGRAGLAGAAGGACRAAERERDPQRRAAADRPGRHRAGAARGDSGRGAAAGRHPPQRAAGTGPGTGAGPPGYWAASWPSALAWTGCAPRSPGRCWTSWTGWVPGPPAQQVLGDTCGGAQPGLLSLLPLHAAAHDRVISSYTPTVRALLAASRQREQASDGPILVVAVPRPAATPGQPGLPELPGVRTEARQVCARFGGRLRCAATAPPPASRSWPTCPGIRWPLHLPRPARPGPAVRGRAAAVGRPADRG